MPADALCSWMRACFLPTSFTWSSAGCTDAGRVRQSNQDAFLARPECGLWVVADGMGGHCRGEVASGRLVECLALLERPRFLGRSVTRVRSIVARVNRELISEAAQLGEDIVIGSTVLVLLALGDHCAIVWAGDSRAYRLRAGELVQMTVDHSLAQHLWRTGKLTEDEVEHHPLSNVLVRAVGADVAIEMDCRVESLRHGDRYLLCSDGLDKELSAARIAAILGAGGSAQEAAQALIQAACEAGGRDNVTVVVVDFLHT